VAKGRVFSLRGKLTIADLGVAANTLVFDYVSPDRKKAWKVESAWAWPITWRADTGVNDGVLSMTAALHTDFGKFQFNTIADPTDNRIFAWAQNKYNLRNEQPEDGFIISDSGFLRDAQFVIDPDTLITKELYITLATSSDGDSVDREWGYMIVLREVAVSPQQSLFQQIKGMGQDIGP